MPVVFKISELLGSGRTSGERTRRIAIILENACGGAFFAPSASANRSQTTDL